MNSLLPSRYWMFAGCIVAFVAAAVLWNHGGVWPWICVIAGLLTLIGIWDLIQTRHTLRRNFPVAGHGRYLMEAVQPMLRRYVVEGDNDEVPFSHDQRSIIYQRAKQQQETRPFGSELAFYGDKYEWINHSMVPSHIDDHDFRVPVGGSQCEKPYSASVFNISAMSFGALSGNAIQALNQGARMGGFIHDTGEGSISQYHRMHGGDLIWEVASGYFGCRNADGTFSEEKFVANATDPQVKMIELKLSQGAKPGHGGMLPGAKVTPEIAAARGIPVGVDCISPSSHSAFSTPVELMQFIGKLRRLSGGKPTGFKFCVGHPWEWFAMVKAMLETNITPDFIVVDGAEGGTGAAPVEFVDHVGVPLQEGLLLVHNTLLGVNLRHRIKIGAAGKVITAFDIARMMALGADWCNSGRGFMMALGCIQAQSCHTGTCPTGVTTQDSVRQQALVVPDKATRVANFHKNTLHALQELVQAAGLKHPNEITAHHIVRRLDDTQVSLLSNLILRVEPGGLLQNLQRQHKVFQNYWPLATAQSFQPLHEPVLRPSAPGSADNAAQSQTLPLRNGIWT